MEFEPDREPDGPEPSPPRPRIGRRSLRWALNAWLVLHISAIIIAPASVAPSSLLAMTAWDLVHPYLQLLYLNHGYHFFAPEPAESALLAFEAERPDGTVVRGRIPNRDIAPRLLYHRHFMLTEHMAGAPEGLRELWHRSYADHIGREYGATKVRLTQQFHYLPTRQMVLDGIGLNHPESYEDIPLGEFQCDAY